MKCPLCGEEMHRYQEKAGSINEIGYCCKDCEIGFYAYKNHDNYFNYLKRELKKFTIWKPEQFDWLENKLE
jgi:hypothetical protein